jgi:TolA-binding protein
LVDEHPDAAEAAEATLALARHEAVAGGDRDEAIRLLEELITRRPNAAVVPEARLELQRLRNRGS